MIDEHWWCDYAIFFCFSYDDILLINKWWYEKVAGGLNEEGQIDSQPLFSAAYQVGLLHAAGCDLIMLNRLASLGSNSMLRLS
jgi:hypothetical protein